MQKHTRHQFIIESGRQHVHTGTHSHTHKHAQKMNQANFAIQSGAIGLGRSELCFQGRQMSARIRKLSLSPSCPTDWLWDLGYGFAFSEPVL